MFPGVDQLSPYFDQLLPHLGTLAPYLPQMLPHIDEMVRVLSGFEDVSDQVWLIWPHLMSLFAL